MKKKLDVEKTCKMIWEKYLEKNDPPEGFPRNPEKEYGKNFKGWQDFVLAVYLTLNKKSP